MLKKSLLTLLSFQLLLLAITGLGCSPADEGAEQLTTRPQPIVQARGAIDASELAELRSALTARIRHELDTKAIPSIAIGLYDKEGALWTDGFGSAAIPDDSSEQGNGRTASRSTVYRVGSVSKLFTDIAVMQLVEQGKLDLDAPINAVLPNFKPENRFGTPITLRQLMCHRSGLVREPPLGNYFDDDEPSLEATVASLNDTALVHEPGTVTKYSNAGIAVVGYVLETLAGVPFEQAVREAVLDPLEMKASDFLLSDRVAGRVAEAEMRTLDRRRYPAPGFQLGMAPAGSLYSTVDDLALFTAALLRRDTVLQPESFEEMFTPQFTDSDAVEGYGLGFRIRQAEFGSGEDRAEDSRTVRQLGHGGAIYGFSTQLGFLPDQGFGVAVTASLDQTNGLLAEIAAEALEGLLLAQQNQGVLRSDSALRRWSTSLQTPTGEPIADELRPLLAGVWQEIPVVTVDATTQSPSPQDPSVDHDNSFRLLERHGLNGAKELLLDTGQSVHSLAQVTDEDRTWLMIDGLGGTGARIEVILAADLGPQLRRNEVAYRKVDPALPPQAPARLRALLGKFGEDHLPTYLFERDQELWAVFELLEITQLQDLTPDSGRPTEFAIDSGMYVGEKLTIEWATDGDREQVSGIRLGPMSFARSGPSPSTDSNLPTDTFRIQPVRPVAELRELALAANPPPEEPPTGMESFRAPDLVELTSVDPTIRLDVRYATTNNFMSTVFYTQPRAFLQRPAAEALAKANQELRKRGYGLLVHDAYRPWYVTKMFWDATPEDKKIFVANPANGSRHNRGSAVDLTLFDLETGEPVQTVGGYDEMTDRSFPDMLAGTERQRWFRELLRGAMEAQGFSVYEFEWWHFDYQDWQKYAIGNKTFEEL